MLIGLACRRAKTSCKHSDNAADYQFYQIKEVKKADMTSLKKRLIRNGLPAKELFDLGEQYKSEIKSFAEEIMEKYGYNPTVVAKIKKLKK